LVDFVVNPVDLLQQRLQHTLVELGAQDGIVLISRSTAWSPGAKKVIWGWALESAVQALIRCAGSDRQGVPILVVGLLRKVYLDSRVREIGGRQLALWVWPGFAYLELGFSEDQLIATARQIVEGAKSPLPDRILPSVGDVLCMTSEIRHWLETRLRHAEGALYVFERALRGVIVLHPSHLDPVAALTDEHRAMLDRLWVLEPVVARFVPQTGGLGPLKSTVEQFESLWQVLEVFRTKLRAEGVGNQIKHLLPVLKATEQVRDIITATIKATQQLDSELKQREEG